MKIITPLVVLICLVNFALGQTNKFSLDDKDLKKYNQSNQPKSIYFQFNGNNTPSNEFNKAGNNLAYAGILILGGGLLHLIAGRDDLATISELNSRVTMAKIGTYMYCGAGIFVISASVNIRNGAINLK
jgi:hypothetical protein